MRPENPSRDNTLPKLRIWQQNLNTSHIALHSLINSKIAEDWDILALQEPPIDQLGNTRANTRWRVVYPTTKLAQGAKPRAVTFINSRISTNSWEQVPFPSADVVVTRVRTAKGTYTLFNIYNDCKHDRTIGELNVFLAANIRNIRPTERDQMIWLGDFNRHHPLWDEERNHHLFTPTALASAQKLLELVADYGLVQVLPKGTPTLQSSSTGNWTRPDNVFCTEAALEDVVECDASPENRGPNTDHVPILTSLETALTPSTSPPSFNYREVDWKKFNSTLQTELRAIGPPTTIANEQDFQNKARGVEMALRRTLEKEVPKTKPHPHNKRWWTKELTTLRNELKTLSKASFTFRAIRDHPCHSLRKSKAKIYEKAIQDAKKTHWRDWLEEANNEDLWIANGYISRPYGDGSKTRIPTLKGTNDEGEETVLSSNEDKSKAFARALFPPPPPRSSVPHAYDYPDPAARWSQITKDQLMRTIKGLSPYKAPGPDGVANIVFQRSPILSDYLLPLFNAVFTLKTYYDPWRESITVILRKPGKPDYTTPKAYRPIALLNTTAKLLSAVVADRTSYILEKHQLLPAAHFGGRPGRSTEDSLLLLETTIRHAWRQKQVVSALFLDIEGAFPNAVTDRLLHNMKKRRLPPEIVHYTERLLSNRKTKIRFDDYESDWFPIRNGIGQGDPLSMILYVIYSSDLADTAKGKKELTLAFVDDTAFIAIGKTFADTHATLVDMMEREGGGYDWSNKHNSRFETSKFALMDFTLSRTKNRPPLTLRDSTITPTANHKFLGVILDQELRWKTHAAQAIAKGMKQALLLRRLSATSWGIPLKLMRQLYQSVVVPKVMYAASVWLQPTYTGDHSSKTRGSKGVAKRILTIQRTAALAATGALKTTPTDALLAHADILPAPLLIQHTLYRATLRLSSLPETHPLHSHVNRIARTNVKRHRAALHRLIHDLNVSPKEIETINPCPIPPSALPSHTTVIATSKKEAIEDLRKVTDRTLVFTDGSCTGGQVGAAAVMYVDHQHVATLRYHLGHESKHTVFEAEAAAMLLAAQLLRTRNETTYPVTILVDNQAVIRSSERPSAKPGHHLLLHFRSSIRKTLNRQELTRKDVTIRWIAGHMEVEGNERADREAKTAATRPDSSSPLKDLPPPLRNQLPQSVSALKQLHTARLKTLWTREWKSSPRYHRITAIDPQLPSSSFTKLAALLPKKQTGTYIQLRTGHIPLNSYLHRFKRSDSPNCLQCGEDRPENVHHYIFQCPRYDRERHILRNALGRDANSMAFLLSNKVAQTHLFKYISATKRLQHTHGETPRQNANAR